MADKSNSIIKVVGVGGGGGNAVNHMFAQGIEEVSFVVCNTDQQALNHSPVPTKILIGPTKSSLPKAAPSSTLKISSPCMLQSVGKVS